MTHYLAYVSNPAIACETLDPLGIEAHAPRAVDMVRPPKTRKWIPKVRQIIPNCMFVSMTPEEWHLAGDIVRTVRGIPDREWDRHVMPFIAAAEAIYRDRMTRIAMGERLTKYQAGDVLNILGGAFLGQIATFVRIVEEAQFPTIEAEVTLFGRRHIVPFDARLLQISETPV